MINYLKSISFGVTSLLLLSACGSDALVSSDEQQPDPVAVDIPIAFVKRPLPTDADGVVVTDNLTQPSQFNPGAALYVKARASANTESENITDQVFAEFVQDGQSRPQYDVKDLSSSFDGSRLVFAMRAPDIDGRDEDEQPTWNIWEYELATRSLQRVIKSDIKAEQGHDTAPAYLPDGRIVFTSTRQRDNQSILLDEGKPQYAGLDESRRQPASVLHVMRADGTDIQQISFNQSHDLDPHVLTNGKIVFSRWDRAESDKGIHLYTINPDGSDLQILYGRHSHQSNYYDTQIDFVKPIELPSGDIVASVRPRESSRFGGDWVVIDWRHYVDEGQATADNSSLDGPGQIPALFTQVKLDERLSEAGRFASFYPLWDGSGRVLFSWSQCRAIQTDTTEENKVVPCSDQILADPESVEADPLYGIWIYDPTENTQLVIEPPSEQFILSDIVVFENRSYPDDYIAKDADPELLNADLAVVHIRSVYDLDGVDIANPNIATLADPALTPATERPARFLRVVKAVSIPDNEVKRVPNSAFGRNASQSMREIIGYVPIEPDGSVQFKVPARIPLAFSVVDQFGQRISERHQNWLQVMPGEVRQCNGCHSRNSALPHGRVDAEATSINIGAPVNGQAFVNSNPLLLPEQGETMAQTQSRINGVPSLRVDLHFSDIWTDPLRAEPSSDLKVVYAELATPAPVTQSCIEHWTASCRIVINYPTHIQPIFLVQRQLYDEFTGALVEDRTCINCHSTRDENDVLRVPAAQLDLSDEVASQEPDHLISYRELLFTDNQQEIIDGALIDRLIPVLDENGDPVYERDEDGELILDENLQPIPVMTTVTVANSLSSSGARYSSRFFAVFRSTGAHAQWLSASELKLLAEWIDIGGQYYNNPFQIPAN